MSFWGLYKAPIDCAVLVESGLKPNVVFKDDGIDYRLITVFTHGANDHIVLIMHGPCEAIPGDTRGHIEGSGKIVFGFIAGAVSCLIEGHRCGGGWMSHRDCPV